MRVSSVRSLCLHLISSAFQRCRLSVDLCRLSVVINSSYGSDQPLSQISISDTGTGTCLEEFQTLRCTGEVGGAETWDGVLSVSTTGIEDDATYYYRINVRNSFSSRRLIELPSISKNGMAFSGTEVCLSISRSANVLFSDIYHFFQKILILQIPNVKIDLVVEGGDLRGSRIENVFPTDGGSASYFPDSDVERLKLGFQSYVLRHENKLSSNCDVCFGVRSNIKVGCGKVFSEGHKNGGMVMEVVIIISELSASCSNCFRLFDAKTEVLYFQGFSPATVPQSLLNAVKSINWKSYGLNLASAVYRDGSALLEWSSLPPCTQIDIVIHCHHEQLMMRPARYRTQPGQSLTKKAVLLALGDLKLKHEGFLLSSHAPKVCSYAPDLARTIAGFILFSPDTDFGGQCVSLLGLGSQEVDGEVLENRIKEKIIKVIATNDKKPQEVIDAASFLFVDDCPPKMYFRAE